MEQAFLFNQNIIPIYISIADVVDPLVVISFNFICKIVVRLLTLVLESFNEGIILINNFTLTERILMCICVYNFISNYVLENSCINKEAQHQEKIKTMEKQIKYLMSSEKNREH